MTKGRRFVPPPDREGIWFRHRGADNTGGSTRGELTSTGRMLSAPFSSSAPSQPQPPPQPFGTRAQTLYHASNPFSTHDNRNTLQDRGEYFGDGRDTRSLGRKLLQPLHKLHHTERDFLKHNSRKPVDFDYNTEFATSYMGRPTTNPPTAHRFPRARTEPPAGPGVPLPTTTTDWFKDAPETVKSAQASTRVMAISQQPYLKHNSWKYSYKGLHKVYPPYNDPHNTKRLPVVDNVLNRYGANFLTGAES